MTAYVAFLRGINVGTSRRVKMAAVREALTDAGYTGVRTLGQSGNVALSSGAGAAAVERGIAATFRSALRIDAAVMLRTASATPSWRSGSPARSSASRSPPGIGER